jgi:hypothetical protein
MQELSLLFPDAIVKLILDFFFVFGWNCVFKQYLLIDTLTSVLDSNYIGYIKYCRHKYVGLLNVKKRTFRHIRVYDPFVEVNHLLSAHHMKLKAKSYLLHKYHIWHLIPHTHLLLCLSPTSCDIRHPTTKQLLQSFPPCSRNSVFTFLPRGIKVNDDFFFVHDQMIYQWTNWQPTCKIMYHDPYIVTVDSNMIFTWWNTNQEPIQCHQIAGLDTYTVDDIRFACASFDVFPDGTVVCLVNIHQSRSLVLVDMNGSIHFQSCSAVQCVCIDWKLVLCYQDKVEIWE